MFSRSAIQVSGIVVCDRNSEAKATFRGSPFRHALRSASLQPIRVKPSTTNRSACIASASCTASPRMHVITHRLEIPVAAPFHDQRLIPTTRAQDRILFGVILPCKSGPSGYRFLATNRLGTDPLYFSDPASTNLSQRFYRAVLVP